MEMHLFIPELFFDQKDGFGEHWGDKFLVAGLWVSAANHNVLWSKHFSVCLVNNANDKTQILPYTNL